MINSSEQAVDFHGHLTDAVRVHKGTVYVLLRRLCEILGVTLSSQSMKLKKDGRFTIEIISATGKDSKRRKMLCLPYDELDGWLLTINPNKVLPEIRESLMRYQGECADALDVRRYKEAIFRSSTREQDVAFLGATTKAIMAKISAEFDPMNQSEHPIYVKTDFAT
jgi:hypothetical protein